MLKAILIMALALRLGLLAIAWNSPEQLTTPDSRGYVELSDSMANDVSFQREGEGEIFRTPGYPAFLIIGALFGDSWWRVTSIVQIAADVLLVYLTYLLAVMLCGRAAGLWAAVFQAVAAVAVVSSVRVLSDGLFALMLTMTVLLLVHHFKAGTWWSLLGAACAAGLSCYLRPTGTVLCAIVTIVLLFRAKRFRRTAAFAGIALAIVGPWIIRNHVVADFRGFSSFAGDSLYYDGASKVIAEVDGISAGDARTLMRQIDAQHDDDEYRTPGQAARDRQREAIKIVRENPGIYARIHLKGAAGCFLPGASDALEVMGVTTGQRGTIDVLHSRGLWAAVKHYFAGKLWAIWLCVPLLAILLIKYVAVAICCVGRLRFGMEASYWLMLLTAIAFVLITGPAGHPRYRVAIEPLLSIAAGAGIVALAGWFSKRKSSPIRQGLE